MRIMFEESFFDEEIRDGFLIRPLMKKNWAMQLELVAKVDEICRKHGLKYWADYGTMLGVVRHKGFIPWDDDVDLSMPRIDYEKFLEYAKDELEPFKLQYMTEEVGDPCRVISADRINTDEDFLKSHHGFPYGVGIDIFVYDNIPDKENEKLLFDMALGAFLLSEYWGKDVSEFPLVEQEESLGHLEKITNCMINRAGNVKQQLHFLCDRICAMYFDDTDVSEMGYIIDVITRGKSRYKKEWFNELIYMPFENIYLPIPKKYNEILTALYGNWNKEEKFGAFHGYPYFLNQVNSLEEEYLKSGRKMPKEFRW